MAHLTPYFNPTQVFTETSREQTITRIVGHAPRHSTLARWTPIIAEGVLIEEYLPICTGLLADYMALNSYTRLCQAQRHVLLSSHFRDRQQQSVGHR